MANEPETMVHVDLSRQLRHPQRWRHRRRGRAPATSASTPRSTSSGPRRIRTVVPAKRSRRVILGRVLFVVGLTTLVAALLLAAVALVPPLLEWLVITALRALA